VAFVTWGGWLPIPDKFVLRNSARRSGGGFHALPPRKGAVRVKRDLVGYKDRQEQLWGLYKKGQVSRGSLCDAGAVAGTVTDFLRAA
jgi:hypothetical protein